MRTILIALIIGIIFISLASAIDLNLTTNTNTELNKLNITNVSASKFNCLPNYCLFTLSYGSIGHNGTIKKVIAIQRTYTDTKTNQTKNYTLSQLESMREQKINKYLENKYGIIPKQKPIYEIIGSAIIYTIKKIIGVLP